MICEPMERLFKLKAVGHARQDNANCFLSWCLLYQSWTQTYLKKLVFSWNFYRWTKFKPTSEVWGFWLKFLLSTDPGWSMLSRQHKRTPSRRRIAKSWNKAFGRVTLWLGGINLHRISQSTHSFQSSSLPNGEDIVLARIDQISFEHKIC